MTEATPFNPQVTGFIAALAALDPGERARLKRDAGKPLAEAATLGLFYRVLPYGVRPGDEETYFLVATLYPLAEATNRAGNFGTTLRQARTDQNHRGLDRRVEVLLDADTAQLGFRLRQAIRLAGSQDAAVHWPQLLHDLLRWNQPNRQVQRAWARAYFGRQVEAAGTASTTTA